MSDDTERLAEIRAWLATPGTITELMPRSVYDREEDVRCLCRLLDAATSGPSAPTLAATDSGVHQLLHHMGLPSPVNREADPARPTAPSGERVEAVARAIHYAFEFHSKHVFWDEENGPCLDCMGAAAAALSAIGTGEDERS